MSKSKKKHEITPLKSDEKSSFFMKKIDENVVTYGEKTCFFLSIFDKISRSKMKIQTFYSFFDSKFEL